MSCCEKFEGEAAPFQWSGDVMSFVQVVIDALMASAAADGAKVAVPAI